VLELILLSNVYFFIIFIFISCSTNPVQNGSPPFHGDALENGEHGESDVIERRDPVVRTFPVFYARGCRVITEVRVVRLRALVWVRVRVARRRPLSLDLHRNQIIQPNASTQTHYKTMLKMIRRYISIRIR